MSPPRTYRAGQSLEDYCRACKTDRMHTAIAVDGGGRPIRVACGYCGSEHNYRGGPRVESSPGEQADPVRRASVTQAPAPLESPHASHAVSRSPARRPSPADETFPIVSDRERISSPMALPDSPEDLELLLRRIIREEAGITAVAPAAKWRGGTLVLRPGTPGLQEKSWPIETFFHKVVMLRNRLRTLEQHVNASDLPDDTKVKLQGYVSGCYGSLTSFNVLFADETDHFKGSGGE
jgi:hypothetical protein